MLPVRFAACRSPRLSSGDLFAPFAQEFDRMVGRAFGDVRTVAFPVDVREEGEQVIVEAELPGVSRDNLDITLEDGVLTIAAEYKHEEGTNEASYHVRERRYGRSSRAFRLPETVDADKVEADLRNGVLTIRIAKREEVRPRRVEVK